MPNQLTKEEILESRFGNYAKQFGGSVTVDIFYAMDEFADIVSRERAISFAEWVIKSTYDFNESTGYWYDVVMLLYPQQEITTEQLYELFIKSKSI